jgi:hypothetical protein
VSTRFYMSLVVMVFLLGMQASGFALEFDGWSPLDSGATPAAPALVYDNTNTLHLFVRGTDNAIYHRTRNSAGVWSGWAPLGGLTPSSPSATFDALTGNLHVFVRGTDNGIYQNTRPLGGIWSGWAPIGGFTTDVIGAATDTAGNTTLAVKDINGTVIWINEGGPGDVQPPLNALLGRWHFTFTIISTFVNAYSFNFIDTTSASYPIIRGADEFGGGVSVARIHDVDPTSTLPRTFISVDPGSTLCAVFLFDQTSANIVVGEYAQFDSTCTSTSGGLFPMTGVRVAGAFAATQSETEKEQQIVHEAAMLKGLSVESQYAEQLEAIVRRLLE